MFLYFNKICVNLHNLRHQCANLRHQRAKFVTLVTFLLPVYAGFKN
jgi:hypothetical protein